MRDWQIILIWSVMLSPLAIWFGGVYMAEKFDAEWWYPAPVPTVSPADAPATPLTGSRSTAPRTEGVVESPMTTSRPAGRPTQAPGSTRRPSSVPDPYTTRRPTRRPPVLPPPTSQAPSTQKPTSESPEPSETYTPPTEEPSSESPSSDPVEVPSTEGGAT